MRVEWAQCAACADRWEEEVILLQEEMRRVVQFLEWRSKNWFTKVDSRTNATPVVCTGLSAYANKQGSVYHGLTIRFSQCWCSTLTSLSLPHTWATAFLEVHKELFDNLDPKNHKQAEDLPVVHTHVAPPLLITTLPTSCYL